MPSLHCIVRGDLDDKCSNLCLAGKAVCILMFLCNVSVQCFCMTVFAKMFLHECFCIRCCCVVAEGRQALKKGAPVVNYLLQ